MICVHHCKLKTFCFMMSLPLKGQDGKTDMFLLQQFHCFHQEKNLLLRVYQCNFIVDWVYIQSFYWKKQTPWICKKISKRNKYCKWKKTSSEVPLFKYFFFLRTDIITVASLTFLCIIYIDHILHVKAFIKIKIIATDQWIHKVNYEKLLMHEFVSTNS